VLGFKRSFTLTVFVTVCAIVYGRLKAVRRNIEVVKSALTPRCSGSKRPQWCARVLASISYHDGLI
jgi:hypothetical protein